MNLQTFSTQDIPRFRYNEGLPSLRLEWLFIDDRAVSPGPTICAPECARMGCRCMFTGEKCGLKRRRSRDDIGLYFREVVVGTFAHLLNVSTWFNVLHRNEVRGGTLSCGGKYVRVGIFFLTFASVQPIIKHMTS